VGGKPNVILITEACSDVNGAKNRDSWDLPHVTTITCSSESEEEHHDDHQAVITARAHINCVMYS